MPPIITTLGVNSFRPAGGASIPDEISYWMLGGGGAGHDVSGGAGSNISSGSITTKPQSLTIVVGAGAYPAAWWNPNASAGSASIITPQGATAISSNYGVSGNGVNGGSNSVYSGSTGYHVTYSGQKWGGGGAGAGANGGITGNMWGNYQAGAGGNGASMPGISSGTYWGTTIVGGGGGGATVGTYTQPGAGGTGGGAWGSHAAPVNPQHGFPNYGAGGGGARYGNGQGSGGSGRVVLRYLIAFPEAIMTGGSGVTTHTDSTYRYYQFFSSGTLTF